MIRKILIANRGEIACRIIRTASRMGISTLAVYSEIDRLALHVQLADEAVCIGPPEALSSYLDAHKLIAVALEYGADAIHPGYGFLSENAEFARLVISKGLIFIGPDPEAIAMMGNKLSAKARARDRGVPLLPGSDGSVKEAGEALKIAREIGFPLLIKAAGGGGGKGMRIVQEETSLLPAMERAMSEARNAFGDASVFIEKYISSPKHIEVQVMADRHGNTVYLFERDCSIQRRHQKVIEECPGSQITPVQRKELGEAAVEVAKACDYVGAGTVEFLMDDRGDFYFLEMNTRLQVEHPVTEMVTGLDLVDWQIRVARGEPLPLTQDQVNLCGHAIELRVYAEDPEQDFLPSTGKLIRYRLPMGEGVRVDNGVEEGGEVSVYYDPLLSKLIAWGKDREEAMVRLFRAISEYEVEGVATTLSFGSFVLQHPEFREGRYDTHFVQKYFSGELLSNQRSAHAFLAACAALKLYQLDLQRLKIPNGES